MLQQKAASLAITVGALTTGLQAVQAGGRGIYTVPNIPGQPAQTAAALSTAVQSTARGMSSGSTLYVVVPANSGIPNRTSIPTAGLQPTVKIVNSMGQIPSSMGRHDAIVNVPAQGKPGGITMDMRRAYASNGSWPVQTIFGLGYTVEQGQEAKPVAASGVTSPDSNAGR